MAERAILYSAGVACLEFQEYVVVLQAAGYERRSLPVDAIVRDVEALQVLVVVEEATDRQTALVRQTIPRQAQRCHAVVRLQEHKTVLPSSESMN